MIYLIILGGILWKIIQYVKVPQEELIEKGE